MSSEEKEDFLAVVKPLLSSLLEKAHNEPRKRELKIYHERINFACPYCGDSDKDDSKKRGNLYFNTLRYICFNESCSNSLNGLLRDFHINPSIKSKRFISGIVEENRKKNEKKSSSSTQYTLDSFLTRNAFIEYIKKSKGENRFGLSSVSEIVPGGRADTYLTSRKIHYREQLMEGTLNERRFYDPVVIILNGYEDKFISFQIRNLKSGAARYFKMFKYSSVLEELKYKPTDKIRAYDNISFYFDIFNVNLTSPVYVLEGYFDACFINNSIAIGGVTQDVSLLEKQDIDLHFLFDCDSTGRSKMKKLIRQKKKVFLWNEFMQSKRLPMPDKTDINDLVLKYDIDLSDISDYFSNSPFDVLKI